MSNLDEGNVNDAFLQKYLDGENSKYVSQIIQIESDKRKFLPNKELAKIFGVKKPQNMTFVEINKHVSQHLTK